MPYLSPMWTLVEAAAWISTRKPDSVDEMAGQNGGNALLKLNEMRNLMRSTGKGTAKNNTLAKSYDPGNAAIERILEELADGILSGQFKATVRSIDTGTRRPIPSAERRALEFHIFDDLPGKPLGFRNRSDRILRWGAPMVAASDVVRSWPHQQRNRKDISQK